MSEGTQELQKSVDNMAAIEELQEKVKEFVEQKEAAKERRLEKSRQQADKLDDLREKVDNIARQQGVDVHPMNPEKDKPEREISTAEKFFIPAKKRTRNYLDDWR